MWTCALKFVNFEIFKKIKQQTKCEKVSTVDVLLNNIS